MRIRTICCKIFLALGTVFALTSGIAQADTTLTPNYILKSKGIDIQNTEIVNLSPDNKLLCCIRRMSAVEGKKAQNIIYIIPVERSGNLGNVRSFALDNVGNIDNLAFTPDSKSLIFTTLRGTKFIKMDCQTGAMTTFMEHIKGKPGFKLSPFVFEHSRGKLLAMGYHYNAKDFAFPNAIVEIDANKNGLEAFINAQLIEHVQDAVYEEGKRIREGFPMLDVGFISVSDNTSCNITSWDGKRGINRFESCQELIDSVMSDSRIVYSVRDNDGTYKLCVYDAKTDEKIVIDSGRKDPYYYTLMSYDGKTIVVSEQPEQAERFITYYARESEGWKLKPIKGLEKRLSFGRQRVSYDGSKMAFHNDDGIRICDLTDK